MQLKKTLTIVAVTLLIAATSCKKKKEEKPDARKALYKAWVISSFESPNADSVAVAALTGVEVVFNADGTCSLGPDKGTFTASEDASSITTTMGESTETYAVSGLSESGLILTKGDESMTLTSK